MVSILDIVANVDRMLDALRTKLAQSGNNGETITLARLVDREASKNHQLILPVVVAGIVVV